jgi:hypothetical protein
MKTTKNRKAIAPVVDIFPQICLSHHDDERVDEEMRLLKSMGFERVYFVLCNPGYPMFSDPYITIQPPRQASGNYSFNSIVSLGDPNFAYLHACHRHGMEAFAVIKPYEGGGGATVPHGAKLPLEPVREDTIGGDRIGFDNLLCKNPSLRVKRKPIADYKNKISQPLTKLTACFCLDHLPQVGFDGIADVDTEEILRRFTLYVSRDNGAYLPVKEKLNMTGKIESMVIKDFNGVELQDSPKRCFMLEIEGINFENDIRYFAVVISGDDKLYTIPQSMIKIFGPAGEIPSTVSMHIRVGNSEESIKSPSERNWGMEELPPKLFTDFTEADEAIEAFTQWGFEHEWLGVGFGSMWRNDPVYAIAKGKLQYMKGTPCEACPEVRAYWLDWVDKCIEIGFDGIDVRLQNHSGMVSDYFSYGYNDEIVSNYREKYGVDILTQDADPMKIMEIRGKFFESFLEDVSQKLHNNGRKFQVHLRYCHEIPKLSHEWFELGFWAMPKIWLKDWKRIIDIADEITLKDHHLNHYDPLKAAQIKEYAVSQSKRVWVHCYIEQGEELNHDFFSSVESDPHVGGILLYETAHSSKNVANLGLIEQCGPVGFHEPVASTLRSLLTDFEFREHG